MTFSVLSRVVATALLVGQAVFVLAGPNLALEARQTLPATLPKPWTSLGCYTDNVNNRALRGATIVDSGAMSIEFCLSYCRARGWSHAGVEWGQECFCDQVIQVPSTQVPIGQCNQACSGNPSQSCGAGNRINIFHSGEPGPTRPLNIGESNWLYLGCYADNVNARTLPHRAQTLGPVTPESCARACRASGYDTAGLEYGHECWCGDNANSVVRPPHECWQTCDADHTSYCGAPNRLSVFERQPPPLTPFYPTDCLPRPRPDFKLFGVLKDPPFSGQRQFVIRIVNAGGGTDDTTYLLLTACQPCETEWDFLRLGTENGHLFPQSPYMDYPAQISINLYQGESPLFQTQATLPEGYGGYAGYCHGRNPYRPYGSDVLIGNGSAGDWAFCKNLTAYPPGRYDVVLEPRANHNHYDIRDCDAADIYVQPLPEV